MTTAKQTKENYIANATANDKQYIKEIAFILDRAEETSFSVSMQLDLHGNKRNDQNEIYRERMTDSDVCVLLDSFKQNTFITGLNLGYNNIGDEGAVAIEKYLSETNALKTLILSYNSIGPVGAERIAKGLQLNDSLISLQLDGNKFGNDGGMAIAGALQVNDCLEELDLNDTDMTTQTVIAFTTVLKSNRGLLNVHLGRPLLTSQQEETTVHIAKMLEVNTRLTELHITKHGMMNFGAEQLMDHLKHNTVLLHLDLSCNRISRDGIKCIADYLGTNPQLQVLNLAYNRAEDDGAKYLAEALRSNMSLLTLVLCSNTLTDDGLCALAKTVQSGNQYLRQLYIWGNKIGIPAAQAFMELTDSNVPRLMPDDTDVRAYVVDGQPYLARLASPY